MSIVRTSGRRGSIVSLGGVISKPGSGLILEGNSISIPSAGLPIVSILQNNPLRVWALIANSALNTANFYINLAGISLILTPGGSILINSEMPWTGGATAQQLDVASASIDILEAVIEE